MKENADFRALTHKKTNYGPKVCIFIGIKDDFKLKNLLVLGRFLRYFENNK